MNSNPSFDKNEAFAGFERDGVVLDGIHRICRAYLDGRKKIPAVRFKIDPEPDRKQKV